MSNNGRTLARELEDRLSERIFESLCDPISTHLGMTRAAGRTFTTVDPPAGEDPEVYPTFMSDGHDTYEIDVEVTVRKRTRSVVTVDLPAPSDVVA